MRRIIGMMIKSTAVLVLAIATAATGAKIDVNGLVDAGEATMLTSPIDIGSAADIFDGNEATLARSAAVNPMTVRIQFTDTQKLAQLRALFSHATSYRWMAECANSSKDLDSGTGSYLLLTDWVNAGDRVWSEVPIQPTAKFKVIEITAERMVGDDYVHFDECELISSTVAFEIVSIHLDPISGDAGLSWRSVAGNPYQVWASEDHTAWTPLERVDAAATLTTYFDTDSDLFARRYYRVSPWEAPSDDLDVLLIERTPRYDYDATKGWPEPGDTVTFHAHVKNWATETVPAAGYRWRIDGGVAEEGTVVDLLAGEERTLDRTWTWAAGRHTVEFEIDPAGEIFEVTEDNNVVTDFTDALAVGFWVEQSVYDYFHGHQMELGLGSNSWEDWAQRHIVRWNQMLEDATWPLTPLGVLDRVRLDKITVVADAALPLSGGLPSNHPDRSDKTVDMMWGFPATLLDGDFYRVALDGPFNYEGSLIHELNHARYLIDSYGFDVHGPQVLIEEVGTPIIGTSYMPYIAWEVVHYNDSGGMMSGDYTWYAEYDAACWNRIVGRRAKGGNYNAPTSIGEWLNTDLPSSNRVTVVDAYGTPLAGASVEIYQAEPGTGWYAKTYDDVPDFVMTTEADGTVGLPGNPFGEPVRHTYGEANGVLIWRVEARGQVKYVFQEVTGYHKEYWRGHTDVGELTLQVDIR